MKNSLAGYIIVALYCIPLLVLIVAGMLKRKDEE